jgi:gluconolactonase
MKRFVAKVIYGVFLVFFLSVLSAVMHAQEVNGIVRLDPAIDDIVPANARVEKLTDSPGPGTREGPVWIRKGGYLIYSDISAKVINKWTPSDDKVSVFQEQTGSDGVTADRKGRLVWAAKSTAGGAIMRLEKDGHRTTLVDDSSEHPLKGPNDLVYKSDGSLYFTDTGNDRVYLLKGGKVFLLINDMPHPNGLAFSPDEKYLYIDDSANRTVTRFEVQPDDTILHGQVIIDMGSGQEPCPFPCAAGYPDGMKVDHKGNMYSTGPGGIWIISPGGKHLGTILVPDHPANLTFGDWDGKTLYVTARPGLYRVRLRVVGIRP